MQKQIKDTSTRKDGKLIFELPPSGSMAEKLVGITLLAVQKAPELIEHYMKEYNVDNATEAVDLLIKAVIDSGNTQCMEDGVASVVIDEVEYWECIHCKHRFSDMFKAIECCAKIKHFEEQPDSTN